MSIQVGEYKNISGLYYVSSIIDNPNIILEELDKREWIPITASSNSIKVQQYGYTYDYTSRKIEKTKEIPLFLLELKETLTLVCQSLEIINDDYVFDQCVVNNYFPG
jgi:hypothetical protein